MNDFGAETGSDSIALVVAFVNQRKLPSSLRVKIAERIPRPESRSGGHPRQLSHVEFRDRRLGMPGSRARARLSSRGAMKATIFQSWESTVKLIRAARRRWFFAACLIMAAGCNNSPPPPPLPLPLPMVGSSKGGVSNTSPVDTPLPPADKSLALDEYIKAGMPAHDRIWNGTDMAKVAQVLMAMGRDSADHLPRYKSPHSGELFSRIIANENLDMHRNGSLPLGARLLDLANYGQSSNSILKTYWSAFEKHSVGDSELVELLGTQLRVMVVMNQMVNEFMPTIRKDDPTYPVRMDGLKQMKGGVSGVVAGSLQTLTETHAYRPSELKKLAGYMQESFPDLIPEVSDASRAEFLVRLRSFANDPKMQYLKPELDSLIAAAEKSKPSSTAP